MNYRLPKRKTISGLIRLTRYQDYFLFVIITTLLGLIFSRVIITPSIGIRLITVFIANGLGVGFSFMINDIEDAPDDAVSPEKKLRNPISAGMLSRRKGSVATLGVGLLSLVTFFLLSPISFWCGVLTLFLGGLYSWRRIRLKSIPVLDLISHSLMLAGLLFLSSYYAFASYKGIELTWVLPFLLVVSVSMYGELYNEVRDFKYDQMAGITHTATLIGEHASHVLMYLLLCVAASTIGYGIWIHLVPLWFVGILLILGTIFLTRPLPTSHRTKPVNRRDHFQQQLLILTVVSLLIWTFVRAILSP